MSELKKDERKYWSEKFRFIEYASGKIIKRNRFHPVVEVLLWMFCFSIGVFILGVTIHEVISGIIHSSFIYALVFGGIGGGWAVFVLVTGRALFLMFYSKYNFCEEGIWIKTSFQKPKLFSWEKFQEVCICYASYTTKGETAAHVVICCVQKGEKKDFYGRWKADGAFHCRKVITLGYTDELYNIMKSNCPYEIVDLRQTLLYKLNKWG